MTDEELLGYIDLHCETELALTHRDHVIRLWKLAGNKTEPNGLPMFVGLPANVARPLIEKARARMKKQSSAPPAVRSNVIPFRRKP